MPKPKKVIQPEETTLSPKKRGRPIGYRKQKDGTYKKVSDQPIEHRSGQKMTTSIKKDKAKPDPKTITKSTSSHKRGRPVGYRKQKDGSWIKTVPCNIETIEVPEVKIPKDFLEPKNKILQDEPTAKDLKSSKDQVDNIFSFVNIVVDVSLINQGISDTGYVHDVFKLFASKNGKPTTFYIDDPYNSLNEEDYSNFFDWLDTENYFSKVNIESTNSPLNNPSERRRFTLVLKGGKPLFILCPVLCKQDGSYNFKINGSSNTKYKKATSLSGIWGLFPKSNLKKLSKEEINHISDFRFTPIGFYSDKKSFGTYQFEMFFNGLIIKDLNKKSKKLISLEIEDEEPHEIESDPSAHLPTVAQIETDEDEDTEEDEEQDTDEWFDDYAVEERKLNIRHKKSNDFILGDDGIYRRRYGGSSDYINAQQDIFYSDTNIERGNYESIGEGHYRSINHQLYDDNGSEDWNDNY